MQQLPQKYYFMSRKDYTLSNPRKTVVLKHSEYTLGPACSSILQPISYLKGIIS
jgi:hypothetical protein